MATSRLEALRRAAGHRRATMPDRPDTADEAAELAETAAVLAPLQAQTVLWCGWPNYPAG